MKTDYKSARQEIWSQLNGAILCAVTKNSTIPEVEQLLQDLPDLKVIAENRWPDCEEKFLFFKNLEKHFIGKLQTNKVKKVVPLVDVIQSVDSFELLEQINQVAHKHGKLIRFCFQVNISDDPLKQGMAPDQLIPIIECYKQSHLKNVELCGLMTIGAQVELEKRKAYFKKFRQLFDEVNSKYFRDKPLTVLSMGMSNDYLEALEAGSTMVRLGSFLMLPVSPSISTISPS